MFISSCPPMCAVKFPRLYAKKSSPTDAFTNWPENVRQLRWLRSDPRGTTFYLCPRHRCWFAHTPRRTTMNRRPYLRLRNRWSLSRWRGWVEEEQKRFQVLQFEVEVVRQSGQQAPSKLSEREWRKVLAYESRNARLRYYRCVMDTEIDWKCAFKELIGHINQSINQGLVRVEKIGQSKWSNQTINAQAVPRYSWEQIPQSKPPIDQSWPSFVRFLSHSFT